LTKVSTPAWTAPSTPEATDAGLVEYLHLVATPDGWQIVNKVWRFADGHGPAR